MIQRPQVLGLQLCGRFAVDSTAPRMSLVGIFHHKWFTRFPSDPQEFIAYAALCAGRGEGTMRLETVQLEAQRIVYSYTRWSAFATDPFLVINGVIPVRRCVFPAPGRHAVRLLFDGEEAADRTLPIEAAEGGFS